MSDKLELPKGYLSWSAYNLWKSSKEGYRKRYYLNEKPFQTAETIFGNHIGRMMEDPEQVKANPILSAIPNLPVKEQGIETEYKGVKLMGYLDQFDPETGTILEMKTGHLNRAGKVPWDSVKVAKHKQLDFYSVLVDLKFGKVNRDVKLVWLETAFKEKEMKMGEHTLKAQTRELQLTGNIEIFERKIYKWERENMQDQIIKTAKEISNDYKEWKRSQGSERIHE